MQLHNPYTQEDIEEYKAAPGIMILAMQFHFKEIFGNVEELREADEKYASRSDYEFRIWKMLKFSETEELIFKFKRNGIPDWLIKEYVDKVNHVGFEDEISPEIQLELDALAHNPNQ
ncbi:hypothetical protein CMI41_01860 [Candidatus Pacearchaeota archaeon]|nr:hypothetical protein [Candidatus Pacearchaeota archaeon]|tara:strand:- start:3436 stop:3786 length:351 start_codon:yes stop_codon:yes gene_type:complete